MPRNAGYNDSPVANCRPWTVSSDLSDTATHREGHDETPIVLLAIVISVAEMPRWLIFDGARSGSMSYRGCARPLKGKVFLARRGGR